VSAYNSDTGEGPLSDTVYGTTSAAPASYTVTFNANGGSTVSPQTVTAGNSLTLPSTTRSSYTFNGWYTSSSGGTRVGGSGNSYTPSSSVTLYAQWTSSGGGGTTQLATPTGLETYVGGSFVQISWNEVSLASRYEVYRSSSANGTYSLITSNSGTSGSKVVATDSSPLNGMNYYKVKAIPLSGYGLTESNLSAYVSANKN
jgi:uncharacterized repeat protein (TIGR02543 family)